ncbi:type II secretion system F family protein [Yersinia mollaretii]|uniref:type II secretion system F family protein n=1 Tax=Yersinia mollaretii TaxID=33060 RepID=UPI0002D4F7BD|nr:type II secretion system F family protein [Yersinia mollaretii]QKJ01839.1 type II secretion system F family protein [Yersinia mollaretii ATCC 43969]
MKISLFIALVIFVFALLLKVKSRSNKVEVFHKINNKEKKQGRKKEEITQEKDLVNFMELPFLLSNIFYFKLLTISIALVTTAALVLTDMMTVNLKNIATVGLIVLIAISYLPKMIIKKIITKRTESILKSLPFFIDITAACVQSGMTIDNSLSYSAKKFKLINADISFIMLKMTKRGEINGLESAIKELHQCTTAKEIRMFCSALQYSISFGSTVYDQLTKLSQDIREMQLLVTEERISKLSAKLTIPLFLFILIPFIVLVISPSILEIITYVQNN